MLNTKLLFAIRSTVNKKDFHGGNEEMYSTFGEMCCTNWLLRGKIIICIDSTDTILNFEIGRIILSFTALYTLYINADQSYTNFGLFVNP